VLVCKYYARRMRVAVKQYLHKSGKLAGNKVTVKVCVSKRSMRFSCGIFVFYVI
jgi:hypothetical protein